MKAGSLYTELNPHAFKSNGDTVVSPFDGLNFHCEKNLKKKEKKTPRW